LRKTVRTAGRIEHALLGAQLRKAREKSGLTIRELADKLGRGYSYVGKIERGEQHIDIPSLLDFADAVGGDAVEMLRQVRTEAKKQ